MNMHGHGPLGREKPSGSWALHVGPGVFRLCLAAGGRVR